MIQFFEEIGATIGIAVARTRSVEALRESEEKYRLHFENVNDIIYSIDPQLRLLSISPSVEKILGYKPQELINRTIQDLNILTPDGLDKIIFDMKRTLGTESIESSVYEFITRDGASRFVEVSGAPIIRNGTVCETIFVARDITERKEAEAWLVRERSMVDRIMKTSPAAIVVVNQEGRLVFANKRAEDLFCLTRSELTQLTYNSPKWRITEYDGNPFPEEQQPFTQVMTTGNPVYGVCYAIELSDGRRMFLLVNGAPIFDEQGHISEVVLTIDDITKYRKR
jgi:PAS domain S-box-containing protein